MSFTRIGRWLGVLPAGVLVAMVVTASPSLGKVPVAPDTVAVQRDGPVSFADAFGTVATIDLPAGHWVLSAKLVLADPPMLMMADCVINSSTHGAWDHSTAVLDPAHLSEATADLALLSGLDLRTAATVRLRCKTHGGVLHASDIRIQAVRAGSLTLIDEPSETTTHLDTMAPVVKVASRDDKLALWRNAGDGTRVDDAWLDVPAGDWVFIAKAQLEIDDVVTTSCRLYDQGDLDVETVRMGTFSGLRTVSLLMVHHDALPTRVHLWCTAPDAPTTNNWAENVRLVALRAGTLLNEPLSATAGLPAGVGPKVIAGYLDGPVDIGTDSAYRTLASMRLPSGSWAIWAKLYTANAGGRRVRCRLSVPGNAPDQVSVAPENGDLPFQPPSAIHAITMQLTATIGGTAGAKVILQCAKLAPQGLVDETPSASWIKITALQVGHLTSSLAR